MRYWRICRTCVSVAIIKSASPPQNIMLQPNHAQSFQIDAQKARSSARVKCQQAVDDARQFKPERRPRHCHSGSMLANVVVLRAVDRTAQGPSCQYRKTIAGHGASAESHPRRNCKSPRKFYECTPLGRAGLPLAAVECEIRRRDVLGKRTTSHGKCKGWRGFEGLFIVLRSDS